MSKKVSYSIRKRRNAREVALQAIYSWLISQNEPLDVQLHCLDWAREKRIDIDNVYFNQLVHGVINHYNTLVEKLKDIIDRPFKDMSPIERSCLLLASYELLYVDDLPSNVSIKEAVQISQRFGATDGYKYINAVLDRLAKLIARKGSN